MSETSTTTAPAKRYTIEEIQRLNHSRGGYFFHPNTMKAFRSRILEGVYHGVGGVYFVTSECNHDRTARNYSVRVFDTTDYDVSTAGDYGDLRTAAIAKGIAGKCADGSLDWRPDWKKKLDADTEAQRQADLATA